MIRAEMQPDATAPVPQHPGMDREAWRLTRELLAAIAPAINEQVVALALVGAGVLLMADFDQDTAYALLAVLEQRGITQ